MFRLNPHSPIKRPLIVTVVAAIGLLLAVFISATYRLRTDVEREDMARLGQGAQNLFRLELREDNNALHGLLTLMERNPVLLRAWARGDRAALLAASRPLFEAMRAASRVDGLRFIQPDGRVFLRVDDPGRHGDRIGTAALRQLAEAGTFASAIELNGAGALTLRAGARWRAHGRDLGFVQLDKGVVPMVDEVHRRLGLDMMILFPAAAGGRRAAAAPGQTRIGGYSLVASTLMGVPVSLRRFIERGFALGRGPDLRYPGEETPRFTLAFALPAIQGGGTLPARGLLISGADVGRHALHRSVGLVTGASLALAALLVMFFSRQLEYIEQQVLTANRALADGRRNLERQVAERTRALRASENKYRAVMEHAGDGILLAEPEGRLIEANRQAEIITGYPREQLLNMTAAQLHPLDERNAVERAFEAMAKGHSLLHQLQVLRKDGALLPVEIASGQVAVGRTPLVVAILRDISERIRAREALRASSQLLERTFDSLDDALFLIDPKSRRVISCNQAVERIFYYPKDEVVGRSSKMLHTGPEQAEAFIRSAFAALDSDGVFHTEFQLRRRDGSVFPSEHTVTEIVGEDGKRVTLVSIARDITRRKHAEAALLRSEERFQLAMRGVNDGLWDWQVQANEIYFSPRWKEMLGYADGGLPNRLEEWTSRVHPKDWPAVKAAIDEHLLGQAPKFEKTYRMRHVDGHYVWILGRGQALYGDDGMPSRMVGTHTDITERVEAEERERQLQAQLLRLERLSTMGEMATSLAHELNQPLAAVVNFAGGCIYRIRAGKADEAGLLFALERISEQGKLAGEIIRRVRMFVSKAELQVETIELHQVLDEALVFLDGVLRRGRVAIRIELGKGLPAVLGDRVQLQQVLMNLIRNAGEAMAEQPEEERRLTIAAEPDKDGNLEVAVSDNGPSAVAAELEGMFRPFHTSKAEGMGMGLAICRTIVESHHGRIWAEANGHRGISVHFTLPKA